MSPAPAPVEPIPKTPLGALSTTPCDSLKLARSISGETTLRLAQARQVDLRRNVGRQGRPAEHDVGLVGGRADQDVVEAVAVEIAASAVDHRAGTLVVGGAIDADAETADRRQRDVAEIGLAEDQVHRAGVGAVLVVKGRADQDVVDAVAVHVVDDRDGGAVEVDAARRDGDAAVLAGEVADVEVGRRGAAERDEAGRVGLAGGDADVVEVGDTKATL